MQKTLNSHTDAPDWINAPEIIALSSRSRIDLKKQLSELKNAAIDNPNNLESVYLAEKIRLTFNVNDPCRLLITIESKEVAIEVIDAAVNGLDLHPEKNWSEKSIFYGENPDCGRLAFVFPGQGSQYVGMGKDLIHCFPEGKVALAQADAVFKGLGELSKYIYQDSAEPEEKGGSPEDRLRATDIAQPAIGAISIAMIKILERFGVKPEAACGHSYGELTALFSSGCFDQKHFIELSAARGKFMAQAGKGKDSGAMMAVKAPLEQISEMLNSDETGVVLANKNSPDQGVLSGPTKEIIKLKNLFKEHKIRTTPLPVSAAFHSSLVSDAAGPFQQTLERFVFHPFGMPVYSNTTGARYPDAPLEAKALLGRHLVNPVNFVDEIEHMHQDGCRVFVEVGPKSVLTGLIKSILDGKDFFAISIDQTSGRRSGLADLAKALCHLASIGYPVDLARWLEN
jgi:malonyl CoA-acyl carrier protein transacylase